MSSSLNIISSPSVLHQALGMDLSCRSAVSEPNAAIFWLFEPVVKDGLCLGIGNFDELSILGEENRHPESFCCCRLI